MIVTRRDEDCNFKYFLRVSTVSILSKNIYKITFHDKAHIEWSDIMEIFLTLKKNKEELNKIKVLTVLGEDCTFEKEAREIYINDHFSEDIIEEAVVFNSLSHLLIFNFTRQYYKPKRLMKAFSDENSALAWLKAKEKPISRNTKDNLNPLYVVKS